jgi:PAS domain S-box-containing protein
LLVHSHSSALHPIDQRHDPIAVARVRFLYDGMPPSMGATVALSGVTALILSRAEASPVIVLWFACVLLVSAVRAVQYLAYRKALRSAVLDWSTWRRRFLIGCSLVGVLWGAASILLFPQRIEYQVFLAFVIAGTSAGAVTMLSADRMAALGFVLPSVIPLAGMFLAQGTQMGLAMGFMVVLYLLIVIAATYRSHEQHTEMTRLNLEADAQRAALERSELERRVSDEKLRALFEFSPLGIALLNERNAVVEANPALLKLLGATQEQIKGRTLGTGLNDLAATVDDGDTHTKTGSFGPIEYEISSLDGDTVPVSVNGVQIKHPNGEVYRWAIVENIQERKANETQLRTLNDRLLLAAQAADLGVWEHESRTSRTFWDPRMYEMFHLDPALGLDPYEYWRGLVHPNDLPHIESLVQAAVRGESGFQIEVRVLLPNREERIIRTAAMMRHDADGAIRVIGVTSDVTDLRRVERMKNEFIATVSHELRTPLTSIRAALGLIANGRAGPLPQQVQHLLTIAERNSTRLALLIDDLLDIERIETGKLNLQMSSQRLQPLVAQAIEASAAHAKLCGVTLELAPSTDDPLVHVDPHRLLQIMANLFSNAAKFSGSGSRVEVGISQQAGRARVEVRDQGPGIASELRPRLFTKFSQGDGSDSRARGGTGLGLAICKALVEEMGGTIDYVSTPGAGTTFYFELPLASE